MDITIEQAADKLQKAQDIVLIAHKSPDGDTLGSCFALYWALRCLGKRVRVECSDPIPSRYDYFLPEEEAPDFEPGFIAAVDIADLKLFGAGTAHYGGRIDLCIDHHPTNTRYAAEVCLYADMAATAQIVYQILRCMGVNISPQIADALFTGITTDTGCFRYSNVTPLTHRIAAELMEHGADAASINRLMFETKSRSRLEVEREVMESLRYDFGGRCAMIFISKDLLERTGATEDELEGLSGLPRRIEGVSVGVTFHERENGYKLSMRTSEALDACAICAKLGGGGHKRAAGCTVAGNLEEAVARVHDVLSQYLSPEC